MKLNKYIEIDLPDDVLAMVVKERKANNITQDELSGWLGIDSTYLSKIENNKVGSIGFDLFKLILKGIADIAEFKHKLKEEEEKLKKN